MDKYAELRAALDAICPGNGDAMLAYRLASDPKTIRPLLAERDALLDQHHRDSKELRRLCAQRDAARKVSKEAGAVIAGLKAERDALRVALVMAEAMLCKQENELRSFGAHEPCAESAILTARAALAQEQGEKHDNQD